MKKNLVTVVILAISIINLFFNILLVFVFVPSTTKVNKLVTEISKVLDIEIAAKNAENGGLIDVSDLAAFQLEQSNPINLAVDPNEVDADKKIHAVQYGMTINLNKTAADYETVNQTLTDSTALIYDMTRDIIGKYTYSQAIDVEVQREIKEEILKSLQDTFNTDTIYSVSFYNWVAQ